VKLQEPGDPVLDNNSIHWVPTEHHPHLPTSKHDKSTDVWAFATTAWQIFSFGDQPLKGSNIRAITIKYSPFSLRYNILHRDKIDVRILVRTSIKIPSSSTMLVLTVNSA